MICCGDIVKALIQLANEAQDYDPGRDIGSRLPTTMRQLLEGAFEGIEEGKEDRKFLNLYDSWSQWNSLITGITEKIRACDRAFAGPIEPLKLIATRATAPVFVVDYRHCWPLMDAYWKWLEPAARKPIDIDHPLDNNYVWPLLDHFKQQLKDRTGLSIFDIAMEEIPGQEDEPWDHFFLPLYNLEAAEDDVVLLELLCVCDQVMNGRDMAISFPEAAYEVYPSARADNSLQTLERVFTNIVRRKKFDCLNPEWRNALEGLGAYEYGYFTFYDWEECKVDITGPDDIEFLFKVCRDVNNMLDETGPLVRNCFDNAQSFWIEFLEMIDHAAIENQSLAKSRVSIKAKA